MSNRTFLYSVERLYPHPVQTLWSAWMDDEKLSQWYSPTSLSVAEGTVTSEQFVGGSWTVGVDVPEYNFVAYFFGKYTQLVQHRLIEHTMNYTQDLGEFNKRIASPDEHMVTIDFETTEDGTLVRFSQFGALPEGEPERAKAGMESYFDNLARFLASQGL